MDKKTADELEEYHNKDSWYDALFYDPSNHFNLETWLVDNRPSVYINTSASKSIIVIHPTFSVSDYKRDNNRQRSFPASVKEDVISNRTAKTHHELLTLADKNNTIEGFWFLKCKKTKVLVELWDSYFIKIALEMYKRGLEEGSFSFLKIEARWSRDQNMGIIMVTNGSFINIDLVNRIAMFIKNLINIDDAINGDVTGLCYKPKFYLDSGFDPYFSHHPSTNIYSKNLIWLDIDLQYMHGVKEWFSEYEERKIKEPESIIRFDHLF